eukprot:TRINITY_DN12089_c0_g1_i4.p1 TRINITY_DN12089_c0_g1~~TRINITY_DN12089_c0_g1_i4.p1  ORF type:complete len:156 (+),score=23.83 TRINITY_DN12089_c0_g1_i4:55-468(+)
MNLLEKTKLVAQQATKTNKCCGSGQFILALLCLVLSPAVVAYYDGFNQPALINLLLFICGCLPGAVHGWYIILGEKLLRRIGWSVLAAILPPIVVGLKEGWDNRSFWISLVLTILCWFPGMLYAWYIIWTYRGNREC